MVPSTETWYLKAGTDNGGSSSNIGATISAVKIDGIAGGVGVKSAVVYGSNSSINDNSENLVAWVSTEDDFYELFDGTNRFDLPAGCVFNGNNKVYCELTIALKVAGAVTITDGIFLARINKNGEFFMDGDYVTINQTVAQDQGFGVDHTFGFFLSSGDYIQTLIFNRTGASRTLQNVRYGTWASFKVFNQ